MRCDDQNSGGRQWLSGYSKKVVGTGKELGSPPHWLPDILLSLLGASVSGGKEAMQTTVVAWPSDPRSAVRELTEGKFTMNSRCLQDLAMQERPQTWAPRILRDHW